MFKTTLHVLSLLFLLIAWDVGAKAGDRNILILGDSLSSGYGIEIDESWPRLLEARLEQSGRDYRVVNASISGHTTSDGLARLPALLEKHDPALVLIALGGNDGLRGYPVESVGEHLTELIRLSQSAGADVLLAAVRLPPNYGERYARPFFEQYAALAKKYGTGYLPFLLEDVALDHNLMQADGLHPNSQAQPVILELVWSGLSPMLKTAQ